MRYSQLFGTTLRQAPAQETSKNGRLLEQAAYVQKLAAGVYSYLPLGLRVLNNIANVVREEMDAIGGQEVHMPALQPKDNWQATGRYDGFDVLYKLKDQQDKDWVLGPSHEEVIVPLAKTFLHSYKDLPTYPYQIQWKFRSELRAKSGLLRGREFLMKDLYSFHASVEDLDDYYGQVLEAYRRVFSRLGLTAILTEASGGTFSKLSHEFQVATEAGEDTIYLCKACNYAWNREVLDNAKDHKHGRKGIDLRELKGAEVGNIFKLYRKFSDPFNLTVTDKSGAEIPVVMGCYGIGISRLMAVITEVYADAKGLVWPKQVTPYQVYLINLKQDAKDADLVYKKLGAAGIAVLYDDRVAVSAGIKFKDADMLGVPVRLVISDKTGDKVEWKARSEDQTKLLAVEDTLPMLAS